MCRILILVLYSVISCYAIECSWDSSSYFGDIVANAPKDIIAALKKHMGKRPDKNDMIVKVLVTETNGEKALYVATGNILITEANGEKALYVATGNVSFILPNYQFDGIILVMKFDPSFNKATKLPLSDMTTKIIECRRIGPVPDLSAMEKLLHLQD
ncbi:unnamed protein product [Strongylus vulgaris]|uniref:Uncharacterized protein n=1 Tax=Strongylus vulgaris TaxID=40348 RepID=A0A3P7LAU1_STRVU|nr:unnamed protein product [Strongylus vulgaris]